MIGSSNDWPFLYHGSEKELTDPANLYYGGGGQFFDPQIMRSLSQASGATGTSGPGTTSGDDIAMPSAGGGINAAENFGIATGATGGFSLASGAFLAGLGGSDAASSGTLTPVVIVAAAVDALANIFLDIFGGGGGPPPPTPQLRYGRHPIYGDILGMAQDEITPKVLFHQSRQPSWPHHEPLLERPIQALRRRA